VAPVVNALDHPGLGRGRAGCKSLNLM
jgi:hypothetical protein